MAFVLGIHTIMQLTSLLYLCIKVSWILAVDICCCIFLLPFCISCMFLWQWIVILFNHIKHLLLLFSYKYLSCFQNSLFQDMLPDVRQRILDGFTPKAHDLFQREFDFFDKVTSISGVLFPLPKEERRAGIRRYFVLCICWLKPFYNVRAAKMDFYPLFETGSWRKLKWMEKTFTFLQLLINLSEVLGLTVEYPYNQQQKFQSWSRLTWWIEMVIGIL